MATHIWLRAETKPAEKRTALTPRFAQQIVDAGFRLTVEKSTQSIFPWQEYESTGCDIVAEHSWVKDAPDEALILGLKELSEADFPLKHRHVHFAHVYKNQAGWESVLDRFRSGGGVLYDLEFLVNEQGRRVAAFGHWAGYAGAALALLAWSQQQRQPDQRLGPVQFRPNQDVLVREVREAIAESGRVPRVLVIGALGRCGRGALELCEAAGAEIVAWDLEETKSGGPFREILAADVFLNCVFVEKAMPPFLTVEQLNDESRRLSVVCDVSCDPYGDYNPVPIYDRCTTFDDPILAIDAGNHRLDLIAIDHLPSLLPRESSDDFCEQLMPYLKNLNALDQGVWGRAEELFETITSRLEAGTE